jgi:Putative MetA-pathway of phenol degradation
VSQLQAPQAKFVQDSHLLSFAERKLRVPLSLPKTPLSIVVAFITFFPVSTKAQSPRDYLNTPVNAAVLQFDFLNTNTETAAASDLPLPNNLAVSRLGVATLLWSYPLGDRYGGVAVSGGYTKVKATGPLGQMETKGFTDPGITFHANFFGAPALRKDEFAQAIPQSYMSVHLTVNAPLGSYDSNSAANTGANRWAFYPLMNLDITPDKGVSWIDLYASGRFFTNNNAFQGNNQLSQNPLGILSAFYSHNIGKRWYAGIGASYDNGGDTYINGISQHNAANGFRPSISISRARTLWKYRLTLKYELTGTTPTASPTNSVLSLRTAIPLF